MPSLYEKLLSHCGGLTPAANALGVSPQVVANWEKRGIPKGRALEVESVTGRRITAREVLEAGRTQ